MAIAYAKTSEVTPGITTAAAQQYNSLMAEAKGAAEGIPLHDVDIVIAYTGFKINTITLTDNSGDTPYIITAVGTATYTGFKLTQIAWVFDAGEMNVTMTEVFSYTGFQLTGVARTLS